MQNMKFEHILNDLVLLFDQPMDGAERPCDLLYLFLHLFSFLVLFLVYRMNQRRREQTPHR